MSKIPLFATLAVSFLMVPAGASAQCVADDTACATAENGASTYVALSLFGGFYAADAGQYQGGFTGTAAHAEGSGLAATVESGDSYGNNYHVVGVNGFPFGNGAILGVYRNADNGFTCWGIAGAGACDTIPLPLP